MTPNYFLLVDDDSISNHIAQKMLSKAFPPISYVVFQAPKLALDHLEQQQSKPSLVLLDLNMPEINGWQFIEYCKKASLQVPICLLTSSINHHDIERAKSIDLVRGYIIKPLTTNKLEVIEDILSEEEDFVVAT